MPVVERVSGCLGEDVIALINNAGQIAHRSVICHGLVSFAIAHEDKKTTEFYQSAPSGVGSIPCFRGQAPPEKR